MQRSTTFLLGLATGAGLIGLAAYAARPPRLPRPGPAGRRPTPAGSGSAHPAYSPLSEREMAGARDRAVRPAGAEAMRDPPRHWSPADETGDESFPASDPPATY